MYIISIIFFRMFTFFVFGPSDLISAKSDCNFWLSIIRYSYQACWCLINVFDINQQDNTWNASFFQKILMAYGIEAKELRQAGVHSHPGSCLCVANTPVPPSLCAACAHLTANSPLSWPHLNPLERRGVHLRPKRSQVCQNTDGWLSLCVDTQLNPAL